MLRTSLVIASGLLAALTALADTVTLKDGSVLNGTVKSLSGGTLVLETSFAGTLSIKQSEIASFSTQAPIAVKTIDDNVIRGTVSGTGGTLAVASSGGTLSTSVDKVKSAWSATSEDPEVSAMRRKWVYQVDVDLAGRQGQSRRLSTGLGAAATLVSAQDSLKLYSGYAYSKQDGVRSEDSFKAGAEYNSFFAEKLSWYALTEGGYDDIKNLTLRLRAGAGLGYSFIKNSKQTLTGRTGLGYRYEDYEAGDDSDVNSPALDFGLLHSYDFGSIGVLNQSLTVSPTFEDFGNYIATHDSSLTLPGGAFWNLRIGVSNVYTSEPPAGVGNWDTTYYAKLGLFWR